MTTKLSEGSAANRRFGIRLGAAISGVLVLCGCAAIIRSMQYGEEPGDVILLFGQHYQGSIGDGHKAWLGSYDPHEDLSVVSHVPTGSEIALYLKEPPERRTDVREPMFEIASNLLAKANGSNAVLTWGKVEHHIVSRERKAREEIREFDELTLNFSGQRPGGARFPMTDMVNTTARLICLGQGGRQKDRPLYFCSVCTIPVSIPREKQDELLRYFSDVVLALTLYE